MKTGYEQYTASVGFLDFENNFFYKIVTFTRVLVQLRAWYYWTEGGFTSQQSLVESIVALLLIGIH